MALLCATGCAFAQQANVKEAQKAAKANDFAKAEQLINQALVNPETANLAATWDAAGQIQKLKIAKGGNDAKVAEKEMIKYFLKADQLAQMPDAKGKINNKFRKANSTAIANASANLIQNGLENFQAEGDAAKALAADYFKTYVDITTADMFKDTPAIAGDTLAYTVAFYGMVAADQAKLYDQVIALGPVSMKGGQYAADACYVYASAFQNKGDQAKFMSTLKEGMTKYKGNMNLMSSMVNYFNDKKDLAGAQDFVDSMLSSDPNNYYLSFTKGYIYYINDQNEDALTWFKKAVSQNDSFDQANSLAGKTLILMAQDFSGKATTNTNDPKFAQEQETLKNFYKEAVPYLEKARELNPDNKQMWINGLRQAYYNLDQMDKYESLNGL